MTSYVPSAFAVRLLGPDGRSTRYSLVITRAG